MILRGLGFLSTLAMHAGAACAPESRPGIDGEAVIGPARSVERVGDPPNQAPYADATLLILGSDRRPVARVTTGADGRFRIDLPPGEYWVTGASPESRFRPRAAEEQARVTAGTRASVTLHFDSGLR